MEYNIPKKLHIIWVGSDNRQPSQCIQSWQSNHPGWQFKLWTDTELHETAWANADQIRRFAERRYWHAVADLMRYEILYREGGVYVDADSFSVRPLDDWLRECEMFACWENTLAQGRARLVSNSYLGCAPQNEFLRYVIETIGQKRELFKRWSWSRLRYVKMGAWRSVGPWHFTRCIYSYKGVGYHNITILPSHMFHPTHYRGKSYDGKGPVYANHLWAGANKERYAELGGQDLNDPK